MLEREEGFPKVDPLFKGRYLPGVLAYLERRAGLQKTIVHAPDEPKPGETTMPIRLATPGLQKRKRKGGRDVLYWSAASLSKKAGAFPDPLIRLPGDATQAEIEDLCEVYMAGFLAWMHRGPAPRFMYDGTIGSLCDCFERHPQSPIRDVRRNTAESYADSLKVLRSTVAKRAVRAVAPIDVKGWYARWRAPKVEGGPERVKRAHDAASAIRMILQFAPRSATRNAASSPTHWPKSSSSDPRAAKAR